MPDPIQAQDLPGFNAGQRQNIFDCRSLTLNAEGGGESIGDAGGFSRALRSEAVSYYDLDENGEVDLIDFVQAVDETILMRTD